MPTSGAEADFSTPLVSAAVVAAPQMPEVGIIANVGVAALPHRLVPINPFFAFLAGGGFHGQADTDIERLF